MTWDELVELAMAQYGLKELIYEYCPLGNIGQCFPDTAKVVLNEQIKDTQLLTAVLFHELGHIHCYNNDLWYEAHHAEFENLQRDEVDAFTDMLLKAEQWVDEWAANEMKKYFPKIQYPYTYRLPSVIRMHKQVVSQCINAEIDKKELKELELV